MSHPHPAGPTPEPKKPPKTTRHPAGKQVTKARVEVQPSGQAAIVETAPGPVTFIDKAKGYYHTLITLIGTVLVMVNELTPVTDHFSPTIRHGITVFVLAATVVVNALKSNEQWVDSL
jgi:hypothetical protein